MNTGTSQAPFILHCNTGDTSIIFATAQHNTPHLKFTLLQCHEVVVSAGTKSTALQPAEASLDWKPNGHMAPGPGIKPRLSGPQHGEVLLHYMLPCFTIRVTLIPLPHLHPWEVKYI